MSYLEWLARRRILVWFVALALAIGGAMVATRLPSGIYPEVEFPRIIVVARSGDAPPDATQVTVTRPLEAALSTVLGIERIRSKTIRGAAELSLQFAAGTDMWRALQLVESRIAEARGALPPDADITVERLTTTSFPIFTYNLTGNIDPRRLRELADLVLRPAFSRVHGVGRVEVLGGEVREIEVIVDPEKAAALHVGLAQISEALKAQSVLQAVGRLEQSHSAVTVMASGEPTELADLRRIPVAVGQDGTPIFLEAIADVNEEAEDRLVRVAGPGGETALISIARLPGASTTDVVAGIEEMARALAPTLPAGVRLTPVYDQATLVDESVHSVRDAILLGMLLSVGVLGAFLRDFRTGLVAAVAVPLTLGATFVALPVLGAGLNLMSLGGLAVAIGLVIDDAIVVVEAISRRLEEGASPALAARGGTLALLGPLVGTTVTTIVVFVPLAWLEGFVGRFFAALATTLSLAVVLSLVLATTLVPVAAETFLREAKKGKSESAYAAAYERMVRSVLRRPLLGLFAVAVLVGIGLFSATRLESGFLPSFDEGAFVLDYFLPAGTSLTDTDRVAAKLEKVLLSTPEVAAYSRRTGAELGPAAATQVNRGDIMVRLRPRGERTRAIDDVIADVRAGVQRDAPEARTEFVQVLQDVLNDLAGTPRPVEVKLFGDDYLTLRSLARTVESRIRDVPGLVDLYPGIENAAPELRFRVDAASAARAGKTALDIATELDTALHGVIASMVRRPDRPVNVRVRYPDSVRFDPARVVELPLIVGRSGVTRLSAVATPASRSAETLLVRESLRPVVILSADHEGRDLGSVSRDIQARLGDLRLPPGYRMEIGGQYEEQLETERNMAAVLGFGLLLVFAVLLSQFERARLSVVVVGAVPLALMGALTTLALTGVPLNASSLMGSVLLVGLVVKNGILLLEQYEAELARGAVVEEAIITAGRVRLRPILMTTLATVAGLLPLALGIGAGSEIQRPLALSVIGGLIVSTAVTLLLLPLVVRLTAARAR